MDEFKLPVQLRWSDLDPNFHVRHSAYYDWGALCRIDFLTQHGLDSMVMKELQFGPILFREECIFKREIKMEDQIMIDLRLIQHKEDYSRWSIRHRITNTDDTLCALLTVDGAWINTQRRKLATPPAKVVEVFAAMPSETVD